MSFLHGVFVYLATPLSHLSLHTVPYPVYTHTVFTPLSFPNMHFSPHPTTPSPSSSPSTHTQTSIPSETINSQVILSLSTPASSLSPSLLCIIDPITLSLIFLFFISTSVHTTDRLTDFPLLFSYHWIPSSSFIPIIS